LDRPAEGLGDRLMTALASTVFLVDDDPGVTAALARLLMAAGFEVHSFSSGEEFLRKHDASIPGCAVLDVAMPDLNGIEVQRRLAEIGCDRPIVFLTGRGTISMSVEAMKAGAVDFLTKPVPRERLFETIRFALEKDRAERLARAERTKVEERLASLSRRESEILPLIISGLLNKQIAAELGTAEKTIKVHRARIMSKVGVRSVAELVRAAMLAGLAPAKPSRDLENVRNSGRQVCS
jgi:FixJ family two-component response regulator